MKDSIWLLSNILLSLFFLGVYANECTDTCNTKFPYGRGVTFCGTDGETYTTHQGALLPIGGLSRNCYSQCGIGLMYVGVCAYICDSATGTCSCESGWGGKDCSSVSCPSSCSGHGSCVSNQDTKGGDYCDCDYGWTAHDCSVEVPAYFESTPYGVLPFGETSEPSTPYYANDKFKDSHPFFNSSAIATIKITVPESNWTYLLDPANLWTQKYVPAKLFFHNGVLNKYTDCTFRVKGASTRLNAKQSWTVKFPKGDDYKDLKGFWLKSHMADHFITQQLAVDMYRAMKAQTFRSSYAMLYINDVFFGLQGMQERLDDKWMKSRYNVKGDMFSFSLLYPLRYLGPDQQVYKDSTITIYEQKEGTEDWSDLVNLITALNGTAEVSTQYMISHVELGSLIRSMALETVIMNSDAYLGNSNNYYLANIGSTEDPLWNFASVDYDLAFIDAAQVYAPYFNLTAAQLRAVMASGHTVFMGIDLNALIPSENPFVFFNTPRRPLTQAALRIPETNISFAAAVTELTNRMLFLNPGELSRRTQAFHDLVLPIIYRDNLYTLNILFNNSGPAMFMGAWQQTKGWLNNRFGLLSSMFVTDQQGPCTIDGVCPHTAIEGRSRTETV